MQKFSSELIYYAPAISFEAFLNRKNQKRATTGLIFLSVSSLGTYGYYHFMSADPAPELALAAASFSGAALLSLTMLRLFHASFYFRGFAKENQQKNALTYEVARILSRGANDVAKQFAISPQGYALLKRLGLTDEVVSAYLHNPERIAITLNQLTLPDDSFVTFSDIARTILEQDQLLATHIREQGVTKEIIDNSIDWVTRTYYQYKQTQRWWSKEELRKHEPIGRDWSYGYTYLLNRFSRPLSNNSVFSNLITQTAYADQKVAEVETILTRSREANVLLVGDPGVGKMDILLQIAERIKHKKTAPELINHQFIQLDTELLLANFDTKQELERTLLALLNQAASAGNIALVINNFAALIRAGASLGVDVSTILEPYLNAPELNLIVTSDPSSFHHELETLALIRSLEVVYVEPPNLVGTEKLLQDISRAHEVRYNVWLSYTALRSIASSAERYIVSGVMPDKAIDLLIEVLSAAKEAREKLVTEVFVQTYVSKKTGIPVGPIADEEREILLDLEGRLHERVVGQEAAISAISSAMRRARAGIQDTNRPVGTFMFLGPTGVGKTETTKALATIFFGSENALERIDMSEFSAPESFERLLGSTTTSGILSDIIQEHPYCVLLLDEFEKATQQVHDLFLQILDEGTFTDGRGNQVNMRNTIIIATSNAGSQFILETIQNNKNLAASKNQIIDTIIKSGVYRPELINRFDGVILFEPLAAEQQKTVAGHLLKELQERIYQQGYTLVVDDEVIDVLTKEGYSAKFGARPMRRALQDKVEEAVAQKIITGRLKKGTTITITKADIS